MRNLTKGLYVGEKDGVGVSGRRMEISGQGGGAKKREGNQGLKKLEFQLAFGVK